MGLKELAFRIFVSSENVVDGEGRKTTGKCTALNQHVASEVHAMYGNQTATYVNETVTVQNHKGHEVGLARDRNGTIIAFDASISQVPGNEGKVVRIWRGDAKSVAKELQETFGGKWNPKEIERALDYH